MDMQKALERHIRELSLPSGRRVGSSGHEVAKEYLLRQMAAVGLEPYSGGQFELPYSSGGLRFANLVGRIPGADHTLPAVLIGAHYDSVIDAPCSDDNAAAVAIGLEAARSLRAVPLRRDVLVAFFDAEEPPHFLGPDMGSIRFYTENWTGADLACAIIMDLVGHDVESRDSGIRRLVPDLSRVLFVMGSESRAGLPEVVRNAAEGVPGLRVVPTLHDYVGDMSDHHAFRLGGQPFLFLSCGQGKHYHSPADTPEWLNYEKIRDTCDFVLHLARGLDRTDRAPAGGCNTMEFEIEMLEKAAGMSRLQIARAVGLESLASRHDLTRVAAVLATQLVVWARG